MKTLSTAITAIVDYLQQSDSLNSPQLRRLGLIYSSYRLIVSTFFLLMSYITAKVDVDSLLPSLLQQTILSFYFLLSLILLGLFYVVPNHQRRQLTFGLATDVIVLSLLLYTNGAPDLQLTMLYMVVVATSFMLLQSSQALVITLLAIIFVIYQQFFYAIANSMNVANVSDAILMSASFLAVGFLSWSISQRLVYVEKMAQQQALEVERLNTINQEVISQMLSGVMVIDQGHVVLANSATYKLLGILNQPAKPFIIDQTQNDNKGDTHSGTTNPTISKCFKRQLKKPKQQDTHSLLEFEHQLQREHSLLLDRCLLVGSGQSSQFIYELPSTTNTSVTDKVRIQIIPLKDASKLILLEDLRREQASAQQLKLASLGQLTASIAHEIRNPLAAISQASQLLMEDVAENEQAHDNLVTHTATPADLADNYELYQMIFAQTKRVNRIIEDILKLSRQQPPNQQQIALSTWMPQFLDNYFPDKQVLLNILAQPNIQFDTHQLEQILINLINNGLRYSSGTHSVTDVEVKIYCVQSEVVIDILDSGNGVPDADIEQLFNPFFTTDKAGTGLGLYLSQAFSSANQARLLYVPDSDRTCFRLIVPATLYPSYQQSMVVTKN